MPSLEMWISQSTVRKHLKGLEPGCHGQVGGTEGAPQMQWEGWLAGGDLAEATRGDAGLCPSTAKQTEEFAVSQDCDPKAQALLQFVLTSVSLKLEKCLGSRKVHIALALPPPSLDNQGPAWSLFNLGYLFVSQSQV